MDALTAPRPLVALACVALGGALGASARYGAGLALRGDGALPRHTLIVNVTGCFAFGLLGAALGDRMSEEARLLVFTGVLGGYTTFSAFSGETFALLRTAPWTAASYVALSVGLGLLAVAAGERLGAALK